MWTWLDLQSGVTFLTLLRLLELKLLLCFVTFSFSLLETCLHTSSCLAQWVRWDGVCCSSQCPPQQQQQQWFSSGTEQARESNHTLKVAELAGGVFFPIAARVEKKSGAARVVGLDWYGGDKHVYSSGHVTCFHLLFCEGGGYSQWDTAMVSVMLEEVEVIFTIAAAVWVKTTLTFDFFKRLFKPCLRTEEEEEGKLCEVTVHHNPHEKRDDCIQNLCGENTAV